MGAAIALGVVGLGASIGGGMNAADSQSEANEAMAKVAELQRKQEYQIFQESKGAPNKEGKVSALLPFYQNEVALGQDAQAMYNATGALLGTPEQQYARYLNIVNQQSAPAQQGDDLLASVFSGRMLDQRLAESQPVATARTAVAQSQRQGILQGMLEQTNQMIAANAAKGYSGAGSAFNNQLLNATVGARQRAAGAMSQADLDNAIMGAAIRDSQRELALKSLDQPYNRVRQNLAMVNAPMAAVNDAFTQRLAPFEFFRLTPSYYRPTPNAPVSPVPNTGQIVGAAGSQLAQGLGNYYANQQLIAQMNNRPAAYSGPPAGSYEPINYADPYDPSYFRGTGG